MILDLIMKNKKTLNNNEELLIKIAVNMYYRGRANERPALLPHQLFKQVREQFNKMKGKLNGS